MSGKFAVGRREVAFPSLRTRKIILARTLLACSVEAEVVPAATNDGRDLIRRMVHDGEGATWDTAGLDDAVRLDEHLAHLASVVERFDRTLAAKERPTAAIAERLRRAAESVQCPRCAGARGHLCNGSDRDHSMAVRSPECWAPFNDLFAFVLAEAQALYGRLAHGFAQQPDFAVYLVTHGGAPPNGGGARTHYGANDSPNSREADVLISLPDETLSARDYLGLLYPLFHEVLVHVPQALACPERRKPYGEDCPFAEGFVDAAAYYALMRALGDSEALPPVLQPLRRRWRTHAEAQFAERTRRLAPGQPGADAVARDARAFGREVFEQLLDLRGRSDRAEEWVTQIALSVNILDVPKHVRRNLLLAIHAGLGGPRNAQIGCLAALDGFAVSGNLPALLGAL